MDTDASELIERLRRAAEPLPELSAAILFGSRAVGRARPESDIDVAVLLTDSAVETDRGELLRR